MLRSSTFSGFSARAWFALSLAALAGCESEPVYVGLDEPLVASHATFKKGKLPGVPPDAQAAVGEAQVLSFSVLGSLRPGKAGFSLGGNSNLEAYSVGFRLLGEGTGYWVVPVGEEDPLVPGQRVFSASFDMGVDLEPGPYELSVVAFDADGNAGKQSVTSVCVGSDLPDNGNACLATNAPPAAIAALRWNADVDLDLSVLSPAGERYDRTRFSQVVDGKVLAELTADASSACLLDGRSVETFVWNEPPGQGTWYLYANLFDACDAAAVSYELTIYRRKDNGDGTFSLEEEKTFGGQFIRAQAQTVSARPLYLTSIKFP